MLGVNLYTGYITSYLYLGLVFVQNVNNNNYKTVLFFTWRMLWFANKFKKHLRNNNTMFYTPYYTAMFAEMPDGGSDDPN